MREREIRIRQRWMPLPLGVICMALALVFGATGGYAAMQHPEEKPSVKVAIPLYGVFVYLSLAWLCNRRTSVVTDQGVSVTVWPLPVVLPRRIGRREVRHCYVRQVDVRDEEGTLMETYHSVGVESLGGQQTDISTPHMVADDANRLAYEAGGVMGVPVYQVEQIPPPRAMLRRLLAIGFWLAVSLGAIFAGVAWELGA